MGRHELTEKTSWDDGYATVAYTADALALAGEDGDREAGALARKVEKLLDRWDTLDAERRARRRAIGRANALVRRRDVQGDGVITALHNTVLAAADQDREHPLFARFFPDALSVVVRMSLESELPAWQDAQRKLGEHETPAAIRHKHDGPLTDAITKGEHAIAARATAYTAAGQTSARIATWRDDSNAVLLGVEGVLKTLASDRKLGTAWVDAFFPETNRARKPAKSAPAPSAPGAPAPSA